MLIYNFFLVPISVSIYGVLYYIDTVNIGNYDWFGPCIGFYLFVGLANMFVFFVSFLPITKEVI